ncbi:MAG: 30S ribosomal protein S21 [Candidatus Liptonbacteria bacterium]|nr:30S ribosomal protein S21 [Candidatus Liptonbacteria bacterium]
MKGRRQIRRREGESAGSLVFRFTKKIQRAGVIKEAKKRRFHKRPKSRRARRISAVFSEVRKKEFLQKKKLGLL